MQVDVYTNASHKSNAPFCSVFSQSSYLAEAPFCSYCLASPLASSYLTVTTHSTPPAAVCPNLPSHSPPPAPCSRSPIKKFPPPTPPFFFPLSPLLPFPPCFLHPFSLKKLYVSSFFSSSLSFSSPNSRHPHHIFFYLPLHSHPQNQSQWRVSHHHHHRLVLCPVSTRASSLRPSLCSWPWPSSSRLPASSAHTSLPPTHLPARYHRERPSGIFSSFASILYLSSCVLFILF